MNQKDKKVGRTARYVKYSICFLVLAGLIGISFMGPQIVFGMMDKYFVNNIQMSERNSMNVEVLNASYEKDLTKRLKRFEDGLAEGKTYFAAETTHTLSDEFFETLDTILTQEWVWGLESSGFLSGLADYIYNVGYNLEDWKRYIIYDKEFEDGVIFMAWYIELTLGDGQHLQLLVDTEDYSLYYFCFKATDVGMSEKEWKLSLDEEFILNYVSFWYNYYNEDAMWEEQFVDMTYDKQASINESMYIVEGILVQTKEDWDRVIYEADMPCRWILGMQNNQEEQTFLVHFGMAQIGKLIPEINVEIPEIVQN